MKIIIAVVSCLIFLSIPAFANAAQIVPVSYTAPPGDLSWSWWYYDDPKGSMLTDGVFGPPWRNEPGYPGDNSDTWRMAQWLGWDSHAVSIVFELPGNYVLTQVKIFTGRDTIPSIYIPQTVAVSVSGANGSWTKAASQNYVDSEFADGTRHTLSIPLNSVGAQSVRIDLAPTQRWIFVDEIQLFGEPVPEPSSLLGLLCGTASLGGVIWRRRSKSSVGGKESPETFRNRGRW